MNCYSPLWAWRWTLTSIDSYCHRSRWIYPTNARYPAQPNSAMISGYSTANSTWPQTRQIATPIWLWNHLGTTGPSSTRLRHRVCIIVVCWHASGNSETVTITDRAGLLGETGTCERVRVDLKRVMSLRDSSLRCSRQRIFKISRPNSIIISESMFRTNQIRPNEEYRLEYRLGWSQVVWVSWANWTRSWTGAWRTTGILVFQRERRCAPPVAKGSCICLLCRIRNRQRNTRNHCSYLGSIYAHWRTR